MLARLIVFITMKYGTNVGSFKKVSYNPPSSETIYFGTIVGLDIWINEHSITIGEHRFFIGEHNGKAPHDSRYSRRADSAYQQHD